MYLRRMNGRGFSLIELLVVIAIIVVLMAILFPVFSIVRARARRVRCESNLMNVSQAMKLYADDHSGFLPSYSVSHPSWSAPPANPNQPQPGVVVTWDLSIQDHLNNKEVLTCPDNPFGKDKRAYAMTAYVHRQRTIAGNLCFLGERTDNIANHAGVVLLFEKGQNLPGSWGDAMGENVRQSHASDTQAGYSEQLFHLKGKNFAFLDGHVKWWKEEQGPFMNQPGGPAPPGSTSAQPGQCFWPDKKAKGGDWPDPE